MPVYHIVSKPFKIHTHMKRANPYRVNGTSFHGQVIKATIDELRNVLGEPDVMSNSGDDKTNVEWYVENSDGQACTIYDWKEYRTLPEYEVIEWHIGAHDQYSALIAKADLMDLLTKIKA